LFLSRIKLGRNVGQFVAGNGVLQSDLDERGRRLQLLNVAV